MKIILYVLNAINYFTMLLIIPVIIIDRIIQLPIDLYNKTIEIMFCVQILSTISITILFTVFSKIKKAELYDNNNIDEVFQNVILIIKQVKRPVLFIVVFTLVLCIALATINTKEYRIPCMIVLIINAISVLYCNALTNKLFK